MSRATAVNGQELPRIDFVPEAVLCPSCGGPVRVVKSKRRTIASVVYGAFEAREIRRRCETSTCPPIISDELRNLAPPGQRYAYDLVVDVGLARYLAGRQRDEIRRRLVDEHGIEISAGAISTLCDRFLLYLERLHVSRAGALCEAQQGGYPLHIDATCESGRGGLFACIDGWRGWVLWAGRVPSESTEYLSPLVEQAVALFGTPLAVVRDMGDGMAGAVKGLRQSGTPDLICHYHFLRAVGVRLFADHYRQLREFVRLEKIRTDLFALLRDLRRYSPYQKIKGPYGFGRLRENVKTLAFWVLDGDGCSDNAFPFALPYLELVRRCRKVQSRVEQWVPRPRSRPERQAVKHLQKIVARFSREQQLVTVIQELEERWAAFSELRDVLRLSKADLPGGHTRFSQPDLPAFELLRLEQIEEAVEQYQTELQDRLPVVDRDLSRPSSTPGIILSYLRRYGDKLFGHPARLDQHGRIIAVVDRTNNVAEHFFAREKQQLRRRLGRAHLARDLEHQPAQVALVANLRSPEYVRVLCGSIENLPAAFASVDMKRDTKDGMRISRDNPKMDLRRRVRALLEENVPPTLQHEAAVTPAPNINNHDEVSEGEEPTLRTAERRQSRSPRAHQPPPTNGAIGRDPRLPPAGSTLERWYKGRAYFVRVLDDGFVWGSSDYEALSSVARAITKNTYDGYQFFALTIPWVQRAPQIRGRRLNRTTLIDLTNPTEI